MFEQIFRFEGLSPDPGYIKVVRKIKNLQLKKNY